MTRAFLGAAIALIAASTAQAMDADYVFKHRGDPMVLNYVAGIEDGMWLMPAPFKWVNGLEYAVYTLFVDRKICIPEGAPFDLVALAETAGARHPEETPRTFIALAKLGMQDAYPCPSNIGSAADRPPK
jgi:hypothetical protein